MSPRVTLFSLLSLLNGCSQSAFAPVLAGDHNRDFSAICSLSQVGHGKMSSKEDTVTLRGVIGRIPDGAGLVLQDMKCQEVIVELIFDEHSGEAFRSLSAVLEEKNAQNIVGKYVICECSGNLSIETTPRLNVRTAKLIISDSLNY